MTINHRRAARRKLRSAKRQAERHLPVCLPGLFYLTDPGRTVDPVATAASLPQGSGVIYRHFGSADRYETAGGLARIAQLRNLVLLIAADPVLAKQVGADGVHWPEAQRSKARAWRHAFPIQTTSAHGPAAIRRVESGVFDAVLVSTVFPSRSPSAGPPMGAARFRQLCQGSVLPLFALGGVSAKTASRASGAGGVAAVEAIETAFAR